MKRDVSLYLFTAALACVVASHQAFGQWSSDSSANNPICTSTGEQTYLKMASDGAGGALLVWQDGRSGTNYDIYAQRISASGTILWTTNGVAVCTDASEQDFPAIASDGSGGAIVTWQDLRNGSNYDIYAQRVNSAGVVQWTTNGVVVCDSTGDQQSPFIVSDGAGGAIITWLDGRSVSPGFYAQRINSSGVRQWAQYGVGVLIGPSGISVSSAEPDGAGGEVMLWIASAVPPSVPYVIRINGAGSTRWDTNLASFYPQYTPTMAGDGIGGAFITWSCYVSTYEYVFVQKVDSSGTAKWSSNGFGVNAGNPYGIYPVATGDGTGGAIVAWTDTRNGNYDIYAQRVDTATSQWTANGVPICTLTSSQSLPFIVGDGSGGAIIAWIDNRNGSGNDVYAQRVNASGVVQWRTNGVAICTAAGDPQPAGILSDGSGGAILSWVDYRNATDHNIYAAGVSAGGLLPVEATNLAANSTAESVTLTWKTQTEADNAGFNVLRRGRDEAAFALRGSFADDARLRGAGTSSTPRTYTFTDNTVIFGMSYVYKIQSVSSNNTINDWSAIDVTVGTPDHFALSQNYPNPFNPTTTIRFSIAKFSIVNLEIYDLLGREVATLANGEMPAGVHEVTFDASRLASGIYFYKLRADNFTATKKLVLLK
ncbi:MAG TPA: T9SS type A sorting domain-containing protein [Bacteroidota bacterium]